MSAEANKALVRQAIDLANEGKDNGHLFSQGHTIYFTFREPSASSPRQYFIDVDDQIAEGDMVTTRWTLRIGSEAEDTEVRAAGTQRRVSGITIDRVSDGQIKETWTSWNPMYFVDGNIEETWTNWTHMEPFLPEPRWPGRP
jgi:hypothetical protein